MNINWDYLYIIGFAFIAFIIFYIIFTQRSDKIAYSKRAIFSPAEYVFFRALMSFVKDDYYVLAKVRVADVIGPRSGLNSKVSNRLFWKVSSKHFDYVLCDPSSFVVVCVIELNDKSHKRRDRAERDVFLEKSCVSAGIPILWIDAAKQYRGDGVRIAIQSAITNGTHTMAKTSRSGR